MLASPFAAVQSHSAAAAAAVMSQRIATRTEQPWRSQAATAAAPSAAATAAAVAAFPWPFIHTPPPAQAATVAFEDSAADAAPSASSVPRTPNFDSILAHIACSPLSPLVDGCSPLHAPNGASSGMGRVRHLGVVGRSRAQSLRRATATFEATQARYFAAAIVHEQVGDIVERLQAAHPPPPLPSTAAAPSTSYGAIAADNHAALVADLACLWHLAQAEPFLLLEDGEGAVVSTGATSATAAAPAPAPAPPQDPTVFGLDWASLSGAFRPASSAIPHAPSASSASSSAPSGSSGPASLLRRALPSFVSPSSSALLGSLREGLVLPELEALLQERVDTLWNDFDPTAEERQMQEQEQEEAAAAALAMEEQSADSAACKDDDDTHLVAMATAGLGPLDSSSLPSLISHRLARLSALEARSDALRSKLALQVHRRHVAVLGSLQLTAQMSRGQTLGQDQKTQDTHAKFLAEKMQLLARKTDKVAAHIKRDTYLGLQTMTTSAGAPATAAAQQQAAADAAAGALILPSLRVIHQTLTALKAQKMAERAAKARELERYQSMGASFVSLAQELDTLQRQIENKKWTLQKMK